jgi:hypothetical protein
MFRKISRYAAVPSLTGVAVAAVVMFNPASLTVVADAHCPVTTSLAVAAAGPLVVPGVYCHT